jgi:transcriptional regulator with XRE-family HTH domain
MHKRRDVKMDTLYNRITQLCKEKGVSGSRMCLDVGLSKSTMSDLKNGRIKGISVPSAQKIAAYFGISVDELYGVEEQKNKPTNNSELSEGHKKLYEFIESVPDDKVELVLKLMKTIVEND